MEPFEFHTELFEVRSAVIEHLAENDYSWFTHYGSVDLQHDTYGIEITAIPRESDARSIETLLRAFLPEWPHVRTFYEDMNVGELGWKVMISRSPEVFNDPSLGKSKVLNRVSVPRFPITLLCRIGLALSFGSALTLVLLLILQLLGPTISVSFFAVSGFMTAIASVVIGAYGMLRRDLRFLRGFTIGGISFLLWFVLLCADWFR